MKSVNNNENRYRKLFYTTRVLSIFLLIAILIGGSFIIYSYYKTRKCKDVYSFINATVVCEEEPVIKKIGYAKLQSNLENYIIDEKKLGSITDVSIYFRDLKNGPVFGVNETAEFAPASLLKLPLALVYFTQAEKDKNILRQDLVFKTGLEDFNQTFQPAEKIIPGKSYKTEELISRMLKHSDNDSYAVLITNLLDNNKEDLMKETFLGLGFIAPEDAYDQVISVRRYGSIFRALYNSSILNAEDSEKILDWLSHSEFTKGIVSGVPGEIKVSHKFGERFTEDGGKQLHDCGIIYFPQNPYLLCIMTRGHDYESMSKVIIEISKQVYVEVEGRRI